MDLAEFDVLADALRRRSAVSEAKYGLVLIEGRTATTDTIAEVERRMGVVLPEKYRRFMTSYGGGMFGSVDLLPVVAEPAEDGHDLRSVNDREFPDRSFVAFAPVGTGDYWGFPVTGGRCGDEVWFCFHDAGAPEFVAEDFLAFVARYGLRP